MVPWGTPQVKRATEEKASPTTNKKVLFDKVKI